jgi:diketogulonate reductase-like aldo/keto reductase
MTVATPVVRLNNGAEMPQFGFGAFWMSEDETESAVLAAIEAGYRSIDTASNFQPWHLRPLLDRCSVVPAVNQVELHSALQQEQVRTFDQQHEIATEAWSPLAQGEVLADPLIVDLSLRYRKTPAQIVLRWHVELGNVVIPKSVTPSWIRENIDIFDFALTADDLAAFRSLDRGARTGPDPDGGAKPTGFSSTGGRWVSDADD